jgi:hypothetical protein
VIWNIFFLEIWRFEKRISLSEKKPPLTLKVNFQRQKSSKFLCLFFDLRI